MTFFRVGPAGIPGSIKTDMNNVLNKKFGTTGQDYPPADWPADVNLMGPLPIKSASGAIASFSDGADGVPVKSCTVSFLPSGGGGTPSAPVAIQGVSGVSVTHGKKNFIPVLSWFNVGYEYTHKDITFKVLADGGIKISGTSNASNAEFHLAGSASANSLYVPKNATYTFSQTGLESGVRVITSGGNGNGFPYSELTDTTTSKTGTVTNCSLPLTYLIIRIPNANTVVDTTVYIQLEVGSTATTYEAYVTPSVVTDTFGQTIYGGTRDLTTDKASVTYALLELAVADMNNSDNYPGWRDCGIKALGLETQFYNEKTNVGQGYSVNTTGSNDILFLPKNSYNNMTQTQWQTNYPDLVIQIAVPLATPTEITGLTPHEIDTLLGDNNIYADTGTTTVEYRADIDLALNA